LSDVIALIDRYGVISLQNDVLAFLAVEKSHLGPEVIEIRDFFPPNHIRALFNFFNTHT